MRILTHIIVNCQLVSAKSSLASGAMSGNSHKPLYSSISQVTEERINMENIAFYDREHKCGYGQWYCPQMWNYIVGRFSKSYGFDYDLNGKRP